MLIEFHLIQNHAPSNLNRDDTGSPKEAVFGGCMRARISSQCLKRSLRKSELFQAEMRGHLASRSRQIVARLTPALRDLGCDEAALTAIGKKATTLGSGKPDSDGLETRQTMFLTDGEIVRLAGDLKKLYDGKGPAEFEKIKAEDFDRELKNSALPRSVDIALFGRMTTSQAFEDVSAALQVAHALSTSRVDRQFDYYTAVDDLPSPDADLGADMIGDIEFNSATYYKYFSLDWNQFLFNLGQEEETARRALLAFLRAAALTSPTGKQNSFAAHNPPDAILVEVKEQRIPISYANAFVQPVRGGDQASVVEKSIESLFAYAACLKKTYNLAGRPFALLTRGQAPAEVRQVEDLEALGQAVLQAIPAGREG